LKVTRRFGGIYRLHLQGRRINSAFHLLSRWFLARFILLPWKWRKYIPPKRHLTLNGIQGVISQKTVLFIAIAMRTSNPTQNEYLHCIIPINSSLISTSVKDPTIVYTVSYCSYFFYQVLGLPVNFYSKPILILLRYFIRFSLIKDRPVARPVATKRNTAHKGVDIHCWSERDSNRQSVVRVVWSLHKVSVSVLT
jgi:hypothetical protein